MRLRPIIVILAALGLTGGAFAAPAAETEERLRALESQVEALRRQVEAGAHPDRATVEVFGFVQAQYETTPTAGQRFLARRARAGVRGRAAPAIGYEVESDFAATDGVLLDAFLQWDGIAAHALRFGQFLTPFTFEGPQSPTARPTIEPAFAIGALYHGRDAGIGFFRDDDPRRVFSYGLTLVNGAGRNQFVATERALFLARVQAATPETAPLFGGRVAAGFSTQQGRVLNRAADRREGEGYAADLSYTRGPLLLRGEWVRVRVGDRRPEGWYALGRYRLTPRWEGVLRYDTFDDGTAGRRAERGTVGVNYYPSPRTRVMLNYESVDGPAPGNTGSGARLLFQAVFP